MSTPRPLALWLALLLGFSPALAEYLRGFGGENPYSPLSTLLAPCLFALAWRGAPAPDPPRPSGVLLVVAGLALELAGLALHLWTLTWMGFPLALVGVALWTGRPSWRVAALAFGLVPMPVALQGMGTPLPETALLGALCGVWNGLGGELTCIGPVVRREGASLELGSGDLGWTLAWVLAQLGWYRATRAGADAAAALRRALAFASATVVLQPLALALALGLLAWVSGTAARQWLSHGPWLAAVVAVVLLDARAGSSRSSPAGACGSP